MAARADRPVKHVLYFTLSAGYRHQVIPLSQAILEQLGRDSGAFDVTATEDTSVFTAENLERYAAVIFYTSGELPMSGVQKTALLDFVRSGGGFLGVHSASDTFYTWPDYLDLVGGYFNDHPWHQAVTIDVVDPSDPLVAFLGSSLQWRTRFTKSATSIIEDRTSFCASTKAQWTLARAVYINVCMAGPSHGPACTARDEYSIARLATRQRFGETPAISAS
jgi:hypothetical protein